MTKPSTTAMQRSLRELIADDSHALTFQTSGQYRAALLKHDVMERAQHTEAFAWAVFAENNNVIIWSKNRAQVESASTKYGRPVVPVIALSVAQQAVVPAEREPVDHDLLPPLGSKVLIHLARQDAWVEHTVTGYYVWPALKHQIKEGEKDAHRVFVRVKDAQGYDNARLLSEVKAVSKQAAQVDGSQGEDA